MSFSTILVKGPELAFAEWMASFELNDRIEKEHMRATVAPAVTQDMQGVISSEAAQPKVLELKRKIETLKKMVSNFFLHQGAQIKSADREKFDAMAYDLQDRFVSLDKIKNDAIKSAVKELNAFAGYLIGNLRMLRFPAQKRSDEPDHHYTMEGIQAHFKDVTQFIADPSNPFCHFTVLASPYESEGKKGPFSSEIQHITKVDPKFTICEGLNTVSQFKESSIPTPYYLINGWLVVSTIDPTLSAEPPAPLAFKDGDETVVYQMINDAEPPPPDAKQRQEIKKSIDAWHKIQIRKMWVVMFTSLIGAMIFGTVGIISFKPNAPFLDNIAARVIRCIALAFGYLSIAAGVAIYRIHSLHERVMGIDNLGKWVQQLRTFVGKYPLLVDKYSHTQRFLTPKEQKWVQVENAKTSIKFPKLCLSLNFFPFQKK